MTTARIELGLERIQELLTHFPAYSRPTIHITGTNGKGSVSALLTSIFLQPTKDSSGNGSTNFKLGRFNSPHLVSVLDSITVNNVPISASIYTDTTERVHLANKTHAINASPFELLAATALVIFESQSVDLVILEVGMGGRLDATNVIPDASIVLSVITSVDLDHQAFLGNTVQAIAREKAGIVRKGGVVVMAPQQHGEEVARVVREVAEAKKARLVEAKPAVGGRRDDESAVKGMQQFSLKPVSKPPPRPVTVEGLGFEEEPFKLFLPLHGEHQLSNLGTALTAVSTLRSFRNTISHSALTEQIALLTPQIIRDGVLACTWPGRLSFHTYTPSETQKLHTRAVVDPIAVIADGAHNAGAAELLSSYLASLLAPLSTTSNSTAASGRRPIALTCILALSHSPPKTPASVLTPLLNFAFSRTQISSFNSPSPLPDIRLGVASLRFTPPEGMPWVASVPPSEISTIVSNHPGANIGSQNVELWTAPDNGSADGALKEALEWAAQRGGEEDVERLVLVAGSLYLVADFYRLIGTQN